MKNTKADVQKTEELIQMRQKISGMLDGEAEKRNSTPPKGRAPRYDDVFFAGIAWLDGQ